MSGIKKLAGETIVYGVSTILGRFLNWFLLPLYLRVLSVEDNGYLTYVYGYIAVFQVIMTFGFETGFFRYAKKSTIKDVFTTLFISTAFIAVLIQVGLMSNQSYWSQLIDLKGYTKLIGIAGLILLFDAVSNLPYAVLRFEGRSLKYGLLRFSQVLITITLNLFFLLVVPKLENKGILVFQKLGIFGDNMLVNVFIANLLGSFYSVIVLSKTIVIYFSKFDYKIFKEVFIYSFPLMIIGVLGMINLNVDKILLPHLIRSNQGFESLGIYGANFKIGVLMAIFTQSFRLAFEPYFYKNRDEANIKNNYADVLKFFTIFGMIIFLGVLLYMDIVNILITDKYSSGNVIIPFVLLGQLFFGMYYSISLWYKLTDRTYMGMYLTFIGSILGVAGNFIFVPIFGYIGAALSGTISYLFMLVISYYLGQKYYFVPYNLKVILKYIFLGIGIYLISYFFVHGTLFLKLALNSVLFILFLLIVFVLEKKSLLKYRLNASTNN